MSYSTCRSSTPMMGQNGAFLVRSTCRMKPVCRMFRSIEVSVIGALLKKPLAAACSSSVLIFPTSGVSQNRSSSAARVLSVLRFRRLHTHRRRPAEESVSGRRSTMSGESWRSIDGLTSWLQSELNKKNSSKKKTKITL